MKILITNDDGINYKGIELLEKLSKKYGEVMVVAPIEEQSAKSHSICIRNGIKVEEIGQNKIAIDSTPADCVRYAYYGKHLDFDIVFSGINKGFNCGEDIMYSGTVAGAVEAGFLNKYGIAFSSSPGNCEVFEQYFDMVMEYILDNGLLEKWQLLNVNIPDNPKGIKLTVQGQTHFDTYFEEIDGLVYQRGKPHFENEINENTDVYAIHHNYISISALTPDKTNNSLLQK